MSLRRKLKNLGKKAKKTVKNAGKAIKNTVTAPGKTIKNAPKNTGRILKNSAKTIGRIVKKTTKTTGRVVKNSAKTTGRVMRRTAAKVTKTANFKLKCHFLICHDKQTFTDQEVQKWIDERIELAEILYAMKPKLKIKSSFSRVHSGNQFMDMKFDSKKKYNAFMNKNFDNISKFFTSGQLNFLVANDWSVGNKNLCGKAFFEFYPGWKKHAVYLKKNCSVGTFSHELGHIFGLFHTFEKGGLCTRNYSKVKGGTKKNGRSNLMDYERENNVYINDCQERAAAAARRRHLTVTGKIKYYKLAGLI